MVAPRWMGALFALLIWSQSADAAQKVLKFSENGSPITLDPASGSTMYGSMLRTAIYDTLYEYRYLKIPYELKPNLAAGMPEISKDKKTYTIKLKKGVFFIDDACFANGKGREVTAQDVVYSIKRHFDPKTRSSGSWLWRGRLVGLKEWQDKGSDYSKKIEGIKALDKYTVQFNLIKPYPQLIYTLAMSYAAVVPQEAVKKYGKEFAIHPVGSGPFRVEKFTPQKTILVKNEKYRKDVFDVVKEGYDEKKHGFTKIKSLNGKTLPIVDKVEVSFMKQPIARWNSFTKGSEIQNAVIPPTMVDRVLASKTPPKLKPEYEKNYFLKPEPDFGLVYAFFNMDDPEIGFNKDPKRNEMNKALRCSIRSGFNWKQRIKRFYSGIGEPFPGIIPPTLDSYSDIGNDSIKYNPKQAKEALKKAGWNKSNLPTLEYGMTSSVTMKQFYEQFRGWMKKIGYPSKKIKMKSFATFGDYSKAMKQRKIMFMSQGWAMDYPDSENLMQLFYGPNSAPGSNYANYQNPEFDKLYEQAASMLPSPERRELYKKMNQILVDDCVTISGFSRTILLVWHKNAIMVPTRNVVGNVFKYVDVE